MISKDNRKDCLLREKDRSAASETICPSFRRTMSGTPAAEHTKYPGFKKKGLQAQ